MRAINLMPGGGTGAARRSAGDSFGVYLLLAGLGVLVVFMALWTLTNRQLDSRHSKLAEVNAEAQAAEARGAAAGPYLAFAALARDRVQTVTSLSATRFDWAHGLREVARVVPDDVWLVSINGTSGTTTTAVGPTSSAAPAPQFALQGCTKSMSQVARLMARLRAVDGVRSVDLSSSAKPDSTANDQCPASRPSNPLFTLSIRFAVPGETKAPVDSTGQLDASAPAATGVTPAPPASPGGTPPTPPTPTPPIPTPPAKVAAG